MAPIVIGVGVVFLLLVLILGFYLYRHNQAQAVDINVQSSPSPAPTMSARAKEVEAKVVKGEDLAGTDLAGLSAYELRVIRNACFARHGRKYDRPGLGDYYVTCSWYTPRDDYKDKDLTQPDKNNVDLIVTVEKSAGDSHGSPASDGEPAPTATPAPTVTSVNELSRDSVLSLMRGRYNIPVKVSMSTSSFTGRNLTDLYTQMVKAKVLSCRTSSEGHLSFCRPGDNGGGLYLSSQEGGTWVAGSLGLEVGQKVPTAVNGISRLDQATAYADVVFSFEPRTSYDLYTRWKDAFNAADTGSERHRALLRLYDDGWRVERFN